MVSEYPAECNEHNLVLNAKSLVLLSCRGQFLTLKWQLTRSNQPISLHASVLSVSPRAASLCSSSSLSVVWGRPIWRTWFWPSLLDLHSRARLVPEITVQCQWIKDKIKCKTGCIYLLTKLTSPVSSSQFSGLELGLDHTTSPSSVEQKALLFCVNFPLPALYMWAPEFQHQETKTTVF